MSGVKGVLMAGPPSAVERFDRFVAADAEWEAVLDLRSGRLTKLAPLPVVDEPGQIAGLPSYWAKGPYGPIERWDPRSAPHPCTANLWYQDICFVSEAGDTFHWDGRRFEAC